MKLNHRNAQRAFTLFEAVLVIVILAILIAVFLPALIRPKVRSSRLGCVNNLKQIGLAFHGWGIDSGNKYPAQVSVTNGGTMELIGGGDDVWQNFQVMSNELNTPKVLFCPEETDRNRVMATTFATTIPAGVTGQIPFTNNNNVSYFIGVDADQTQPQMLLSGDDGFTVGGKKPKPGLLQLWTNGPVAWNPKRHSGQGNVLLADGSVVGTSGKLFFGSGTATNRLLMP